MINPSATDKYVTALLPYAVLKALGVIKTKIPVSRMNCAQFFLSNDPERKSAILERCIRVRANPIVFRELHREDTFISFRQVLHRYFLASQRKRSVGGGMSNDHH